MPSSPSTRSCWPPSRRASTTVGASLERHRQKAALAEVMRIVGEANAYVSKTEPFKLKGDDQRERLVDRAAHAGPGRLRYQYAHLTVPAARRQPGARGARRRGRVHADAASRGRRRPRRRRPLLPRHHRRLLGDAALGVAAGRRRHADRQADRRLRQARPGAGHRGRAGPARRLAPGGTRHHTDPLAAPKMARRSTRRRDEPCRPGTDEAPTA